MKIFKHVFTQLKLSKVLLHKGPMWNKDNEKIWVFSMFSLYKYAFFLKSFFYVKNLFFWHTLCSCSSKNKGMGRGQLLQILLNRPLYAFLDFWATLTLCASNEFIFHLELGFKKNIQRFLIKIWRKLNFLDSSISHRCVIQ